MQPSCTTMFLIWSLGSVPLTCTPRPGGSSGSIMIYMSGDALSTFWRGQLRTARVFQGGSHDLFAVSTWVSPRSIQVLFHLISTLTPDTSLPSSTLSLMIGLRPWLTYALPDFNSNHWARLFGDSRFQFPFDETNEVDKEIAGMDSDEAEVLASKNQTEVAAAMDKGSEVQPLPVPPLPESELRSPTLTVPSIPLETPTRPLTPTSHRRESRFQEEATLNSPPTEEVRNPVQSLVGSPAPTVPVSLQSPPRQPVFSPVREKTPIVETRERLQARLRHLHQRHLQFILFLFPLLSHQVALVAREWRLLASATTEGNPADIMRHHSHRSLKRTASPSHQPRSRHRQATLTLCYSNKQWPTLTI